MSTPAAKCYACDDGATGWRDRRKHYPQNAIVPACKRHAESFAAQKRKTLAAKERYLELRRTYILTAQGAATDAISGEALPNVWRALDCAEAELHAAAQTLPESWREALAWPLTAPEYRLASVSREQELALRGVVPGAQVQIKVADALEGDVWFAGHRLISLQGDRAVVEYRSQHAEGSLRFESQWSAGRVTLPVDRVRAVLPRRESDVWPPCTVCTRPFSPVGGQAEPVCRVCCAAQRRREPAVAVAG